MMLKGQISPNGPLVREYGEWGDNGKSNYKEVYFIDMGGQAYHPRPPMTRMP